MRIWSLHPKYLDAKGLVALWRETLLAKHVLKCKTKGYRNHPQLIRFNQSKKPLDCINTYLSHVCEEAGKRGYNFDSNKIDSNFSKIKLNVTNGQLKYEAAHLLKKLKIRDRKKYFELRKIKRVSPHPMFKLISGKIEEWEKIQPG